MGLTPRQHNVLSYGGALLLMPGVALMTGPSSGRWLPIALWVAHFSRRMAESLWVHRYSKRQFPWGDALVEYAYYWGFATWIALSLPVLSFEPLTAVGALLFVLSELGNARSHWLLRQLRAASPQGKFIPRGFLFEWISCPHYLCEISSWIGFTLVTQTWASGTFTSLGAAILGFWAHTRHVAYRREFDGQGDRELYPPSRRALLPGVF
jgi:very-long-chain enoyl-CoA reductase